MQLLKDDGVSYGDYLEQLTYLLFLKMADEFSKPPYNRKLPIPNEHNWESMVGVKGAKLELKKIQMEDGDSSLMMKLFYEIRRVLIFSG